MMDWQPIETAPKDGTRIHLGFENMKGFDVIGYFGQGNWRSHPDMGPGHSGLFHGRPEPTHWMPLPEPPKT